MLAETAEAWLAEWEALAARDGIARDARFWAAVGPVSTPAAATPKT